MVIMVTERGNNNHDHIHQNPKHDNSSQKEKRNNGDDNKQNGGDQIDDKTNMNTYVSNDTVSLQLCSDQAKIVEPNAPFGLLSFLEKNKIYDLKFVLKLLCQTGLYGAIFVAAHSRKNILIALELFALSSAPKLNQLCCNKYW